MPQFTKGHAIKIKDKIINIFRITFLFQILVFIKIN